MNSMKDTEKVLRQQYEEDIKEHLHQLGEQKGLL